MRLVGATPGIGYAAAAAPTRGVVTQNRKVECVTRTQVSPCFAWGCGDDEKFCDAIGWIIVTVPEAWEPKVRAPMVRKGTARWAMDRKGWKPEGPRDFGGVGIPPIRG